MAMLACGVITASVWYYLMRRRLNAGAFGAIAIALLCSTWGVFCLKIFSLFEAIIATTVNGHPYEPANMSLFGAVFLDPLLTYVIAKVKRIDFKNAYDIFCIGYMLPILFGRTNCFFAGCCVSGTFYYPIIGTVVWPIREIEVLYYLGFIAVFAPRIMRKETCGEVYPLFMASYGVLRFVLEWTRELYYPIGPLHLSHIWALISFAIGLVLYKRVLSTGASAAVGRVGKTGGTTR
jgi:prolipoprotein diacylglyceryltransferase